MQLKVGDRVRHEDFSFSNVAGTVKDNDGEGHYSVMWDDGVLEWYDGTELCYVLDGLDKAIYDNYASIRGIVASLSYDEKIALIKKTRSINESAKLTDDQVKNWYQFSDDLESDIDLLTEHYRSWVQTPIWENLERFHAGKHVMRLINHINKERT